MCACVCVCPLAHEMENREWSWYYIWMDTTWGNISTVAMVINIKTTDLFQYKYWECVFNRYLINI